MRLPTQIAALHLRVSQQLARLSGRNAGRRDDLRRPTPARTALPTPAHRRMIPELDIYRAANLLIDRHGGDAVVEAAQMIDRMLELGSPGRGQHTLNQLFDLRRRPTEAALHSTYIGDGESGFVEGRRGNAG